MKIIRLIVVVFAIFCSTSVFSQCDFTSGGGEFSTVFPIGSLTNGDELCITGLVTVTSAGFGIDTEDYSSIANLTIRIQSGGELRLVGGTFSISVLYLSGDSQVLIEAGGTLSSTDPVFDLNSITFAPLSVAYAPVLGDPSSVPGPASVSPGGLPITLTHFEADKDEDLVHLGWGTSYEENFSHFEIEKSNNALEFEFLGFVEGKGGLDVNSDYQYTDNTPLKGITYYRLKAVDFDGSFEYSAIQSVINFDERNQIRVFPNPVKDEIAVNLNFTPSANGLLRIIDYTGNIVLESEVSQFTNRIDVSGLPQGLYMSHVIFPEMIKVSRIQKQ